MGLEVYTVLFGFVTEMQGGRSLGFCLVLNGEVGFGGIVLGFGKVAVAGFTCGWSGVAC